MPDEPKDDETVFNPARDRGGVQRVPLERPAVAPTPDHSGRDPEGPKLARFDPDDDPTSFMDAAAKANARPARPERPKPSGKKGDESLRRFLES